MTSRDEVIAILAPLAVELAPAERFEDEAEYNIYVKALSDLPTELLRRAADRASRTRTFMPKPAELRADAEAERRAWLASERWEPCEQCGNSAGLIEIEIDGVVRAKRCDCWKAHQEKLVNLGLMQAIAERPALPPAREDEEIRA